MVKNKIAVVIPAYRVSEKAADVINSIPSFVKYIILVDDNCPENTGNIIKKLGIPKTIVLFNEKNLGVGGATIEGFKKAIDLKCDILIKLDGDGQMDPSHIKKLIDPIIQDKADYTKGNRFKDINTLSRSMPIIRLFGNSILSFLIKFISGYWNLMDPTNGYFAIKCDTYKKINFSKISKRYFFEIDLLVNLNINNFVVSDVAIPAIYRDEKSSLNIFKVIVTFPFLLIKSLIKRIFFKYYLYNFNMFSIYLLFGLPLICFGLFWGIDSWLLSIANDKPATTGTIMLSVLPILLGFQMLIQAIQIDIDSVPKK